jgi:AcrR family transcriptional regulator
MGRPKTISDDELLRVARALFREHGHTATTRDIAQAAGISEAILYQRFNSKSALFFAAMAPQAPDVEALLGPVDPPGDARGYLRATIVRVGEYFADILPLVVHMMTHPSFDPAALAQAMPSSPSIRLREGLAMRLAALARRKRIKASSGAAAARLLISLAHDWALGRMHGFPSRGVGDLKEMVDVVWAGLRLPIRETRHGT